jgi:hypothetical protein
MSTRATLGLFLLAIAACPSTPAAEEPPYSVASEIEQACPQCSDCDCEECFKCPLLGFIQPTDTTWANFISPMTNPVFFEDPRTLSEVRFIFAHHHIPTLAGGAIPASDIQVFAAQFRIALSDDLSIIGTKDGYVIGGGDAPLVDGWADVALVDERGAGIAGMQGNGDGAAHHVASNTTFTKIPACSES